MRIQHGFHPSDRDQAAALYWEAFGAKLGRTLGPKKKALCFVSRVMRSDHAISAYTDDGNLVGIVGFKTINGALVGGTFSDFVAIYGLFGAIWRSVLLSLLKRDVENKSFLMDGLFVTEFARGKGVGKLLLDEIRREGADRGYDTVRLDVINTNIRAKALYQRNGFSSVAEQNIGFLGAVFGFSSATTMIAPTRPVFG